MVQWELGAEKRASEGQLEPEGQLESQGLESQGLEPEGLEPEGLEPEELEPEELEPEELEPEGLEPEGLEPERPVPVGPLGSLRFLRQTNHRHCHPDLFVVSAVPQPLSYQTKKC